MEIEKLVEHKKRLERELVGCIANELVQFRDETGFSPSSVYVNLVNTTTFGDGQPRYYVSSVHVDLAIRGL